jgi:hypothetical protein
MIISRWLGDYHHAGSATLNPLLLPSFFRASGAGGVVVSDL